MPLTPFQSEVLRLLAKNRSPQSYVAGGIALNARENVRWTAGVDVFHDVEQAVIQSSEADVQTCSRPVIPSVRIFGRLPFGGHGSRALRMA